MADYDEAGHLIEQSYPVTSVHIFALVIFSELFF